MFDDEDFRAVTMNLIDTLLIIALAVEIGAFAGF
jgi:hypothetical protein